MLGIALPVADREIAAGKLTNVGSSGVKRTQRLRAPKSAFDRLCCKTLFGPLKTNFPGCGRGDRIIVWGTTATSDELTGHFGSALEDTSTGDYRLVALFAEKTLKVIFGVLQHNLPIADNRNLIEKAFWPLQTWRDFTDRPAS